MFEKKKVLRIVHVTPTLRSQLENSPVSMSGTACQALINAASDDSLILKALKRRMALPPAEEENSVRMSISLDQRLDRQLNDIHMRSRLPREEVLRLVIEAYTNRL